MTNRAFSVILKIRKHSDNTMKKQTNNKKPAIFLDRDGVLIQRHLLTWQKKQMRLAKNIAPVITRLNQQNIPIIVITNQPVVARGLISENGVKELHDILQSRLKKRGASIDRFYFCPHHPEATLKEYRKKCSCRKPNIGLFKKAAKDFNVDLSKSIFIGDMTQDILAGKKIGTKTILLTGCGYKGKDGKFKIEPDYKTSTLSEALTTCHNLLFNNSDRIRTLK